MESVPVFTIALTRFSSFLYLKDIVQNIPCTPWADRL